MSIYYNPYNWEVDIKQDIETYIDWDIDTKINTEIYKDLYVDIDVDVDVKDNSAFIEGVIKDFASYGHYGPYDGKTGEVDLLMNTITVEDTSSLSVLKAMTDNVKVEAVSSASDKSAGMDDYASKYYLDSATFTEVAVHVETADHFTIVDFNAQSVTDG